MNRSSSRENTLPVGLFGVFRTIAFVRFVNARFHSSSSISHVGHAIDTNRARAPLTIASGP